MEKLIEVNGKLEESVNWLIDAEEDLQTFDSETKHHYGEVKEALRRLADAREALEAIRRPIAPLIEKAQSIEKEEESWTP